MQLDAGVPQTPVIPAPPQVWGARAGWQSSDAAAAVADLPQY